MPRAEKVQRPPTPSKKKKDSTFPTPSSKEKKKRREPLKGDAKRTADAFVDYSHKPEREKKELRSAFTIVTVSERGGGGKAH